MEGHLIGFHWGHIGRRVLLGVVVKSLKIENVIYDVCCFSYLSDLGVAALTVLGSSDVVNKIIRRLYTHLLLNLLNEGVGIEST